MHVLLRQLTDENTHSPHSADQGPRTKTSCTVVYFRYAKLKYLNGDLLSIRERIMHAVNIAILVGHVRITQSAESKADKSC